MIVSVPSEDLREEGSEVVSFTLVSFLVLLIFLALLQTALVVYRHNVVISVAGEGARRYALLGGSASEASSYVNGVCTELLGEASPCTVQVRREPSPSGNYEVGVVTVRTTLPVVLNLGPEWLEGRGSAVMEESLP